MASRILFLHHTAIIGGAELHLLTIARHFRETSTVVLFADGPFRHALEAAGVQVRVFPSAWAMRGIRLEGPRFSASNVAAVLRLARFTAQAARGADLIYANSPKALLVSGIARLVRRKPVIWFLHDLLDETHFSSRAIRLLVRVANRTAVRILANSNATAAAYVSAGGRRDLVQVAYDGFNATPFLDRSDLTALRVELRLEGSRTLGVFGRITRWKGQEVILRALADIPLLVAVFVGVEEDAVYGNELRLLAREVGVADRVHFLGFREDVPQLIRLVDCIVHVSTDPEPFGRVVVEGMLARRPVIATDAGGVPEIIEHGVSGILVTPGSSAELAEAILRILSDPVEAERMAASGQARALALFGEARMLREIQQHVSEVLSIS
ncbi:MAG TPA: glycosyltransferase family 4 protein [Chthoniobacterales bacterium]